MKIVGQCAGNIKPTRKYFQHHFKDRSQVDKMSVLAVSSDLLSGIFETFIGGLALALIAIGILIHQYNNRADHLKSLASFGFIVPSNLWQSRNFKSFPSKLKKEPSESLQDPLRTFRTFEDSKGVLFS